MATTHATRIERDRALERRLKEIERRVGEVGRYALDVAMVELDVSRATLYKDRDQFAKRNIPILIDRGHFVRGKIGLSSVGQREHDEPGAKKAIGFLGAELVLSPAAKAGSPASAEPPDPGSILVSPGKGHAMPFALTEKLRAYWRKPHRQIALDCGTTTAQIGERLAGVRAPNWERRLSSLQVLTNSKPLLNKMDGPECTHDIVLIGGELRKDTGAFVGPFAEKSLDCWGSTIDLAIIGASNLNHGRWCFASDSDLESALKRKILAKSHIRCVAADSRKLINPHRASGWTFAALAEFDVDLVLTDSGVDRKQTTKSKEDARQEFLRQARGRGVYIAVAPNS